MPDKPPEPTKPVRYRRYHKERPGPNWRGIAIVAALLVSAACIGTVVWAFVGRRPAPVAYRAPAASASLTPVAPPREGQSAAERVRQLGEDGSIAKKMGLKSEHDLSKTEESTNSAASPMTETPVPTRTVLDTNSPEVIEARSVLDAYLSAPTWRQKLPHIFRAARCESLMADYYEKRCEPEPEPRAFLGAGYITGGESKLVNLSFSCPSRPEAGVCASFHRSAAGKLLLDWAAWIGFSEKSWSDLKKQRPVIPTLVRAMAEESDYYNYEFTDQGRWLAVKLRSPDGEHYVTGYCDRGSGTGIALSNLVGGSLSQKASKEMPAARIAVTVRVAFPVAAQSDNCVNITSLLADTWLLFDGEF